MSDVAQISPEEAAVRTDMQHWASLPHSGNATTDARSSLVMKSNEEGRAKRTNEFLLLATVWSETAGTNWAEDVISLKLARAETHTGEREWEQTLLLQNFFSLFLCVSNQSRLMSYRLHILPHPMLPLPTARSCNLLITLTFLILLCHLPNPYGKGVIDI